MYCDSSFSDVRRLYFNRNYHKLSLGWCIFQNFEHLFQDSYSIHSSKVRQKYQCMNIKSPSIIPFFSCIQLFIYVLSHFNRLCHIIKKQFDFAITVQLTFLLQSVREFIVFCIRCTRRDRTEIRTAASPFQVLDVSTIPEVNRNCPWGGVSIKDLNILTEYK